MNSPENILRSGVPHAVETNLVTRHAINPRHTFLDTDASVEGESKELTDASQVPAHVHEALPPAPVIEAEHLHDNIQAVDQTAFTDNWQSVSAHEVQDNWQSAGSHEVSDKWQSLGKTHQHDNLQSVPIDAMQDNQQSLGGRASIEEKKLYLEKKSIRDNRQKVVDTPLERAAPQWHTPAVTGQSERQGADANAVPKTVPNTTLHEGPNSGPNAVAQAWTSAAQHELEKALDDDALRARMQKLKATVRVVNNSLSELDHKP